MQGADSHFKNPNMEPQVTVGAVTISRSTPTRAAKPSTDVLPTMANKARNRPVLRATVETLKGTPLAATIISKVAADSVKNRALTRHRTTSLNQVATILQDLKATEADGRSNPIPRMLLHIANLSPAVTKPSNQQDMVEAVMKRMAGFMTTPNPTLPETKEVDTEIQANRKNLVMAADTMDIIRLKNGSSTVETKAKPMEANVQTLAVDMVEVPRNTKTNIVEATVAINNLKKATSMVVTAKHTELNV